MTMTATIDAATALEIYRTMARIAATDQRIQQGLAAGDLQFQYYPCGGQEAIPAAIAPLLTREDKAVITYRCIHDIVAKGAPIREIIAEMYGRETGMSKGKGGPMHLSDPDSGLMVTTGIVGAGAPIAAGIALGEQLKGSGNVVTCSFGDGAANIGAVHEALNLAALWQLPIVFVCQNNLYAEYTSFAASTRSPTIAGRAEGYGMAGERVDGTDPFAVHAAAARAIARARGGEGPTLLECVAHRLQGHSFGSEEVHMDAAALAAARSANPVKMFRQRLIDDALTEAAALDAIDAAVTAEIDDAQAFADASQSPPASELYVDVFASADDLPDAEPRFIAAAPIPDSDGRRITFGQAVNEALDMALAADARVILLGEDIEDPAGGIVKATAGLSTRHGRDRVRGTPISEQAIVGAAIGASLAGFRPVAEIMIVDFAMVCMDQIANHAAKLRYMSGGRTSVPITLRMLTAGNVGSFGAQHSQSLEAWFAHIPGLKIVAPSNPVDAKGMLLSCIDDPDPCIFLEAMRCYFSPGLVPAGDYRVPLGKAAVARPGRDLTIVAWSWAVQEALAAADLLAVDGVEAEVIDLRSIVPLDMATVLESVGRTGRALIVHAAVEFGGFGAELAARIQEAAWGRLKAPVARLGARYTPIPFAQNLEAMHFPGAEGIAAKARAVMADR
ncbi:dehydrogenase E1 component subunit alpha/beta [Sphingomonas sp. SUN019]|uniref:alpha-ketoacid dehydrogenase subunit alpha/beta n=1 Tax=Sphingomonas sp. SUN019 TaxID=2937788 RepID=UPI0021643FB9|nr:dehydrogenase E1 component subunit alpha/beta [Sphingomonas sp. SUN019]UVO49675.1 dehydrogenase E1 component subunit alpha/beta [Sphingomonas sp. SUN019]